MRAARVSPRWYHLNRWVSTGGLGQSGAALCFLFGAAAPFGTARLAALHPADAQLARGRTADTIAMARLTCPDDARELL